MYEGIQSFYDEVMDGGIKQHKALFAAYTDRGHEDVLEEFKRSSIPEFLHDGILYQKLVFSDSLTL